MDPIGPVPAIIDGWLLRDLPAAAIDALIQTVGPGSGSPLLSVELRHLGGRLADAAPGHGALASLEAGFATATYSVVPDTDRAIAVGRHAAMLRSSLAPWEAERNYPNFAERSFDLADLFSAADCERLGRVKAQYDPENLIVSTHPVSVDRHLDVVAGDQVEYPRRGPRRSPCHGRLSLGSRAVAQLFTSSLPAPDRSRRGRRHPRGGVAGQARHIRAGGPEDSLRLRVMSPAAIHGRLRRQRSRGPMRRRSAQRPLLGAPGRIRTADAQLRTLPLYPLSYGGADRNRSAP